MTSDEKSAVGVDVQATMNTRVNTTPNKTRERTWLLILGMLVLTVILSALTAGSYYLWDLRETSRNASCRNDVYMLHKALLEYAVEHEGLVPPISRERGNLMIKPDGFYPEFLKNACWLQCEWGDTRRLPGSHKNDDLGLAGFNDDSFCYLPWAIKSEKEGLAFIDAYKSIDLAQRNNDLAVQIDGELRVLPRIRLSSETLRQGYTKDAPEIPIAVEWPDNSHRDGTVLYSNGWIVTMKMGEGFPMTEKFISALSDIAQSESELFSTRRP